MSIEPEALARIIRNPMRKRGIAQLFIPNGYQKLAGG